MSLLTVASYSVCTKHAHMVDGYDAMRSYITERHAEAVTVSETHDPLHFCACRKPAFWLLRAVKIAPGHYVEAEIERPGLVRT